MDDTTFTQGEWRVIYFEDKTAGEIAVSDGLNHHSIAVVSQRRDEWRANAHLIAAAKDLYAACQLALSAFERRDAIDWGILEAALAKARGE